MYKYKKIISPILMIVLTITLISLIGSISIIHNMSINSLKNKIISSEYYEKSENIIKKSLKSYMSEDLLSKCMENNRVANDIDSIVTSLKSNTLTDTLNYIEEDFNQVVVDNIIETSSDDANITQFTNKVTNIYVSNLLPTSEISMIHSTIAKLYNYVIAILVFSSIFAILCILYLINAGKQKKWLFVTIYNVIILCVLIILVLLSLLKVYYMNEAVSSLIQTFVKSVIIDIGIMGGLLLIIVAILNYVEYFRGRKK